MHSVESIAAEIVRREGGYVNDPDDPGGATNHGVTIHTMRRLGLDLTGDGKVDATDVRALNPQQAAEIYVRHYFQEPKLNLLPQPLQASVFDMQVNAGANAVRILQRLMAVFGLPLKDDGVVGPITARVVAQAMDLAPDHPSTPTASRGATTTTAWATSGPPAASTPVAMTGQGWLDRSRRGVHLGSLPPDAGRARRTGVRMGLMGRFLGAGAVRGVGEAVGGVAEVFIGNRAERDAGAAEQYLAALGQYGAEFARAGVGRFDGFVNGLNRLPRPLMTVGTLGLFVYAMAAPAGFAIRMQGLALVPEPLWWLLGAIVSFYFGARELHYQRNRAGQVLPRVVAGIGGPTNAFVSAPVELSITSPRKQARSRRRALQRHGRWRRSLPGRRLPGRWTPSTTPPSRNGAAGGPDPEPGSGLGLALPCAGQLRAIEPRDCPEFPMAIDAKTARRVAHLAGIEALRILATRGASPGGCRKSSSTTREGTCHETSLAGGALRPEFGGMSTSAVAGEIPAAVPLLAAGNLPPVCNAHGTYFGAFGQPVTFNSNGSYDPDGVIVSYAWTFGDGNTGSGRYPTHSYAAAGDYTVGLCVVNKDSAQTCCETTAHIAPCGSCPPSSQIEGEPLCGDGYVDSFNGGCNSTPRVYSLVFCRTICGETGTYILDGQPRSDTDWYRIVVGPGSFSYSGIAAGFVLRLSVLTNQCPPVTLSTTTSLSCQLPAPLVFNGPGAFVLVASPDDLTGVPCPSEYVLTVSGPGINAICESAVENTSWGHIKARYRH